jgi:hypothetical protein
MYFLRSQKNANRNLINYFLKFKKANLGGVEWIIVSEVSKFYFI